MRGVRYLIGYSTCVTITSPDASGLGSGEPIGVVHGWNLLATISDSHRHYTISDLVKSKYDY